MMRGQGREIERLKGYQAIRGLGFGDWGIGEQMAE